MKSINELDLSKKKYIFFDMDGTLIDSIGVWNHIDMELIRTYGNIILDEEYVQEQRHSFLDSNLDKDIYEAYSEFLIKKYNMPFNNSRDLSNVRLNLANRILESEMDFKDGVVELINLFKELDFKVSLATMTSVKQLKVYSEKNERMYSKLRISDAFDFITTKDDVKRKKPDGEIYRLLLSKYNAKEYECLVFEDSITGVKASKDAGIEVVNIYDKYSDIDRKLIDELTDYKINSYYEFINYLNKYKSKRLVLKQHN